MRELDSATSAATDGCIQSDAWERHIHRYNSDAGSDRVGGFSMRKVPPDARTARAISTDLSTRMLDRSSVRWSDRFRFVLPRPGRLMSRSCRGPPSYTPFFGMRATLKVLHGVPMMTLKNSPARMRSMRSANTSSRSRSQPCSSTSVSNSTTSRALKRGTACHLGSNFPACLTLGTTP